MVDSLRGELLISNGGLFDPNFRHTVVLVIEHDDDGALGLVLNRPAPITVEEAIPELAPLVPPEENLYVGGPVQPGAAVVLAEFDDPPLDTELLVGTIGLLGDTEVAIEAPLRRARVFGGYSGWGAGQLEDELDRNDWIVTPASDSDVFTDEPRFLWHRVLRRLGGRYAMLATMPFDPSNN